jgi:hypothetical protein
VAPHSPVVVSQVPAQRGKAEREQGERTPGTRPAANRPAANCCVANHLSALLSTEPAPDVNTVSSLKLREVTRGSGHCHCRKPQHIDSE